MTRAFALAALASCSLLACDKPVKVKMEPSTLELGAKGRHQNIHATPLGRNNAAFPHYDCAWSSTNPKVAEVSTEQEGSSVKKGHNEVTVTSTGEGSAAIRCTLGDIVAEVPVVCRYAKKLVVTPPSPVLEMQDDQAPTDIKVQVFDSDGKEVQGRLPELKCADENVCRGDKRSQLWAVGPGDSKVFVKVDDASTEIVAHVVDKRSAEGRPKAVKGNPMLGIDGEYGEEAQAKKAAGKGGTKKPKK